MSDRYERLHGNRPHRPELPIASMNEMQALAQHCLELAAGEIAKVGRDLRTVVILVGPDRPHALPLLAMGTSGMDDVARRRLLGAFMPIVLAATPTIGDAKHSASHVSDDSGLDNASAAFEFMLATLQEYFPLWGMWVIGGMLSPEVPQISFGYGRQRWDPSAWRIAANQIAGDLDGTGPAEQRKA